MHALFARLRRRLTFANATSCLALFVALGGTSYAAATIGSEQIKTGAVGKSEIRKNAVGKSEIRANAVGKSEVRRNAVGLSEIATGGVASSELKDGTIQLEDVSPTALASLRLNRASVTTAGKAVGGNAKGVTRTAAGAYVVEFDHDVSACTYNATLATVKDGATVEQPPAAGTVTVGAGTATTTVAVHTYTPDATPMDGPTATDAPFNLLVAC